MTSHSVERRIRPYPIMLDLTGRDVLVVGGGGVGERRILGLLDAEACVTLISPEATGVLSELASAERITWERRSFFSADVSGRAVVFAATGIDAVDGEVVSAARACGILANAADDLERCDFHVPAIARRGDIVIAVGTAGAAPALAARLRDRFASSLGPEWERFAELLSEMRRLARERIAQPAERMRTLTRAARDTDLLAAIARGSDVDPTSALEAAMRADAPALREPLPERARVSLVGSGPGAPDLLTVRAIERVREADVIVYDDLVDRRVLDEASPDAELVYCGKRGWRTGPERPGPELLAQRALEGGGKHVVRLKGGDPSVFGRLAEETDVLDAADVPYDVVPGVTAALAAAAAAHITLTERGVSNSVTLLTGIGASNSSEEADATAPATIARLLTAGGTVAVYMGLRVLPEIALGLIGEGLPDHMPVAVIGAASLPDQAVVRGTLSDIAERIAESALPSPAVVIIGEVVA